MADENITTIDMGQYTANEVVLRLAEVLHEVRPGEVNRRNFHAAETAFEAFEMAEAAGDEYDCENWRWVIEDLWQAMTHLEGVTLGDDQQVVMVVPA